MPVIASPPYRVRVAALFAEAVVERDRKAVRRDLDEVETDERLRRERGGEDRRRFISAVTLLHQFRMRAITGDEKERRSVSRLQIADELRVVIMSADIEVDAATHEEGEEIGAKVTLVAMVSDSVNSRRVDRVMADRDPPALP